jgi:hypothetical protein
VYNGVVPTGFGADALGGGINRSPIAHRLDPIATLQPSECLVLPHSGDGTNMLHEHGQCCA